MIILMMTTLLIATLTSQSFLAFLISLMSLSLLCLVPSEHSMVFQPLVGSSMLDFLAWALIVLSLIITSLSLMVINKLQTQQLLSMQTLVLGLMAILVALMSASSTLMFYFLFETSLIPIGMLILGWGYQTERIQAMKALMLYTMIASLPLLGVLVFMMNNDKFLLMNSATWMIESTSLSTLINIFVILGFLVKFPMFFTHLWLPKAHVEAPVIGSMILAALLLKLAGLGLWRLTALIDLNQMTTQIQMLSLLGGGLVGILCLRQMDLKVMIAYSSVSHMSFVISLMFAFSYTSFFISLLLMVAHGISSSAMFAGANYIYELHHSRNLVLMNGLLSLWPKFTIFWFLACLGNMGTPPTVNFMGEMWSMVILMNLSLIVKLSSALIVFFAVAFTLVIYASSVQGQPSLKNYLWNPSFFKPILILSTHSILLFSIIFLFI